MANPGTNRQVPDHSIMDFYNKQAYLGNQFVYSKKTTVSTAGTETPLLLIQGVVANNYQQSNPTGIFIVSKKLICLTASSTAIFKWYFNPSYSDTGPIVTGVNVRPGSSTTAIAEVSTGPTIVSNGTLIEQMASVAMTPDNSTLMSIIDTQQALLLTATVSANSTDVGFTVGWFEL